MKGSCIDCANKNDCYKLGSFPSWEPYCPAYDKGEIDTDLYDEDDGDGAVAKNGPPKMCPFSPVTYTTELRQMATDAYKDADTRVVTEYSPKGTVTHTDYFSECLQDLCLAWDTKRKICKRIESNK